MSRLIAGFGALALVAGVEPASRAMAEPTHETIVFIRHGEKQKDGLGQLDCQGLNRALALPRVLAGLFPRPAAIFAPNPSVRKQDGVGTFDYVRPLATIEPTAIRLGLPVDTSMGFDDTDKLMDALDRPDLRDATVLVAWEHHAIDKLVPALMTRHGGDPKTVPPWAQKDFDGISVVTVARDGAVTKASFEHRTQGLTHLVTTCPG